MHIIGGTIAGLSNVQELTPIYHKRSSVIAATETTIVDYTVPTGKAFFVQSVLASGRADGEYKFYINGEQKLYNRTSSATRDGGRTFGGPVGIKCVVGDYLQITVTHWESASQEYEGTIAGFLQEV
jgi:hypothetical protein